MSIVPEVEQVHIDFIMLADKAEFINGKLYMMGGLYDRFEQKNLNVVRPLSIVVGIEIPWALTNQPHSITMRIETEDGDLVGKEITADVTMARPITARPGQVFRAVIIPNIHMQFPSHGTFRISAKGPHGDTKSTALYVLDQPV